MPNPCKIFCRRHCVLTDIPALSELNTWRKKRIKLKPRILFLKSNSHLPIYVFLFSGHGEYIADQALYCDIFVF